MSGRRVGRSRFSLSTAIIVFIGLLAFAAGALVWLNRASSVVVNAALPVAIGSFAALSLVFVFNRPAPLSKALSVLFVIENSSRMPVSIRFRPFSNLGLSLAGQVRYAEPKTFDPPAGQENGFDFIRELYHQYLQKILIDDLASKQFGTWRTRVERFGLGIQQFGPAPDAGRYPSKVLPVEELEQAFGDNPFKKVHSGFGQWALPPRTTLQIEKPDHDPQLGERASIRLRNRFADVTITTTKSMSMVGLGTYTPIVGLGLEEAQA